MIFYTDITGRLIEPKQRQYICATPDALYLRTPEGDERAVQMHWVEWVFPMPPSYNVIRHCGHGTLEKFPWQ